GAPVDYECHAGLQCRSVPLSAGTKQLVAITGRTFIKASKYRRATSRAIKGYCRSIPPTKICENVILSGSVSELNRLDRQVSELDKQLFTEAGKRAKEPVAMPIEPEPPIAEPT